MDRRAVHEVLGQLAREADPRKRATVLLCTASWTFFGWCVCGSNSSIDRRRLLLPVAMRGGGRPTHGKRARLAGSRRVRRRDLAGSRPTQLRKALAAEPDDDVAIEAGNVASPQKALKSGNEVAFRAAMKRLGTKAWALPRGLHLRG